MPTQIELQNITKSYYMGNTSQQVLKGLNLNIQKNELVAVMGPSGSGKTTLLNILGMLDKPTSGVYKIAGQDVTHLTNDNQADMRNQLIGFVFQMYYLLPSLKIWENVALPLTYRRCSPSEMEERARAMLAKVDLEKFADHKPNLLSGGQQQRVSVARALVGNPALILADEPTGALDTTTGKMIMDLFIELNQKENLTIIIVTHDPNIAEQCQKTYRLKDGNFIT